jgi:uncharacterized protein YggE
MRRLSSVAVTLGLSVISSIAAAQSPGPPSVKAEGTGVVAIIPDRALLAVSVETQAPEATDAAEQHAAKVAAIRDSLRPGRFSPDTVQMTDYAVSPVRGFVDGVWDNVAYRVRSSLLVPLDRPEMLGAAVGLVLKARGTRVTGARFESDSLPSARRRAVAEAVAQAQSTATATAVAAGGRLGSVIRLETRVNDGLGGFGYGAFESMGWFRGAGIESDEIPSPRGEVRVTAQVQGEWRIERR